MRFGGMQVRRQRDRAFLVGGIDNAVESLSGLCRDRQESDVVDADQVGAHDLLDRPVGAVIDAVPVDQRAEGLEGEPLDVAAVPDRGVTESFQQMCFAGAGRSADDEVLVAVDPLER